MGLPVEASVKLTVWPVTGLAGAKLKAATGAEGVTAAGEAEEPPPQWTSSKQDSASVRKQVSLSFMGSPSRSATRGRRPVT